MAGYQTHDRFAIHGLDEVKRRLRELPVKLRQKALRKAVRAGANVLKKHAVANAKRIDNPETAENIAKNISVQFAARSSKLGRVVFRIGVRGGAKRYTNTRENRRKHRVGGRYKTAGDKSNPGGNTWYWRHVELGTSRTRAQPFLEPAGAQGGVEAAQVMTIVLNHEIDKIVASGVR